MRRESHRRPESEQHGRRQRSCQGETRARPSASARALSRPAHQAPTAPPEGRRAPPGRRRRAAKDGSHRDARSPPARLRRGWAQTCCARPQRRRSWWPPSRRPRRQRGDQACAARVVNEVDRPTGSALPAACSFAAAPSRDRPRAVTETVRRSPAEAAHRGPQARPAAARSHQSATGSHGQQREAGRRRSIPPLAPPSVESRPAEPQTQAGRLPRTSQRILAAAEAGR